MTDTQALIVAEDLEISYGDFVIQRDLNFTVKSGEIFIIMGGSDCGKTTVMRSLIGLKEPSKGKVFLGGVSFWEAGQKTRDRLARNIGIVYQSGALWGFHNLGRKHQFASRGVHKSEC